MHQPSSASGAPRTIHPGSSLRRYVWRGGVLLVILLLALTGPAASARAAGPTTLVKDILPGLVGSNPDVGTVSGEKLFFAATDRPHGRELWMSNSLNGSTRLVR